MIGDPLGMLLVIPGDVPAVQSSSHPWSTKDLGFQMIPRDAPDYPLGMLLVIPEDVPSDPWECSWLTLGMFPVIPGDVPAVQSCAHLWSTKDLWLPVIPGDAPGVLLGMIPLSKVVPIPQRIWVSSDPWGCS